MLALGLILLVVNAGLACLNISQELYWVLPINAIGIYYSIDILKKSF